MSRHKIFLGVANIVKALEPFQPQVTRVLCSNKPFSSSREYEEEKENFGRKRNCRGRRR